MLQFTCCVHSRVAENAELIFMDNQQKVKKQFNSAGSVSRAQRAVKYFVSEL
jgi:hypothetical protein